MSANIDWHDVCVNRMQDYMRPVDVCAHFWSCFRIIHRIRPTGHARGWQQGGANHRCYVVIWFALVWSDEWLLGVCLCLVSSTAICQTHGVTKHMGNSAFLDPRDPIAWNSTSCDAMDWDSIAWGSIAWDSSAVVFHCIFCFCLRSNCLWFHCLINKKT